MQDSNSDDGEDTNKQDLLGWYKNLQNLAAQKANQVNQQVAQGGRQFMSPDQAQSNADFITNQIGKGAVSGGVSAGGLTSAVEGGTQGLANAVNGEEMASNIGNGGIVKAPGTVAPTMESSMAANANPNRVDTNSLLQGIKKRWGNGMVQ